MTEFGEGAEIGVPRRVCPALRSGGECAGQVRECILGDVGGSAETGDTGCRGGGAGDGGCLGVGGAFHDDAQVARAGRVRRVGRGVGETVGAAEVDAVLNAGGLPVQGELVAAECAVVQAVVGVRPQQVKRDVLWRGRGAVKVLARKQEGHEISVIE
jgi:hypothetical protein